MRIRRILLPFILSATFLTPAAIADSTHAPSGIDVASWQGNIDWASVNQSQEFAFVKATEGLGYQNPQYTTDIQQSRTNGLIVGAYHYARPGTDPVAQAAEFAAAYNAHPQDLPPVMDLEQTDGLNPDQLQAWTRTFLGETERLTGRKPIVYTYRYFWQQDMANTTEFNRYPLWLAAYQNDVPGQLPGGWDQMAFWQRADDGRVSGIHTPVDMNLFNGTPSQLNGFSGYGGVLTPGETVATGFDLGASSKELIAALLAAVGALGILPADQAGALAQQLGGAAGLEGDVAGALGGLVKQLDGNLPVGDLQAMAQGNYTIGDLLLLLNAAGHQVP
ncbi:Lysozyme M1 precursor [Corynebacterium kalinowskii]|uniref:Lysozyme M1 n=1 Tax=Corynebacterium kalinowskii TaxID=2675216 RepID=A0A6B8VPW4_9CORY|nr:glycoside hydrolase family 25 protein [Corynebacterium kalinowskii]QGU01075.1 Lysozyme M1 precursor [Corynebacterium kalinowskii]